ncbi:MAG TPA: murein L,D-transpeptidase catalytic domain family protein [Ohtaekwangia sp.]
MNYFFAVLISLSFPLSSSLNHAPKTETFSVDSVIHTGIHETEEAALLHFEDSVVALHQALHLSDYNLPLEVFRYAMIGYNTAFQQGRLNNKKLLTIIDFTQSSRRKRFYTLDLENLKMTYNTYVSHGKNTGEDEAKHFSNIIHSNQSSLGFYLTAETYIGSKGYSLKLDGLEKGFNDNMRARAVVMHEADYVSEYWIKKYGRLGRSQGCPALPVELSKEIIDTIKDHTLIFAYYNNSTYLQNSFYLNIDQLISNTCAMARGEKTVKPIH